MKRILFIGTHGQFNIGDELLLSTFMYVLNKENIKYYVNSYTPKDTKQYLQDYNVETFHTKKGLLLLTYYIFHCDYVIFGGGSIIKELYAEYGGGRYNTLHVINAITLFAKILGKTVIMSHIGVGPIETEKGKKIAKQILSRIKLITVRDKKSFSLIQSLGIQGRYLQASDAAFSLTPDFFFKGKKNKKLKKKNLTIGINVCRNIQNNTNWDYYIETLAEALVKISKMHKVRFVGIPMQSNTSKNNDFNELKSLKEKVLRHNNQVDFTIANPSTHNEVAVLFSECDIVVAERLHALIISIIMKIPIVALEYDPKIIGMIKDLELDDIGININRKFPRNEIFKKIAYTINNHSAVKLRLNAAYDHAHLVSLEAFKQLSNSIK